MCPRVVASGRAAARVATKGACIGVSPKHPCATQLSSCSFKTPPTLSSKGSADTCIPEVLRHSSILLHGAVSPLCSGRVRQALAGAPSGIAHRRVVPW